MKHSSLILIATGLVLGFTAAQAQPYPRDDPYYRQRGYERDYGYRQSGSLVRQVISDIDRAASNSWVDSHERRHFDQVVQKLQEFEDRWAQGYFDKGKLDKAIENLQHLADADQVRGRDRDIFNRDLAQLRQFRSTRGRYSYGGYRDYRYGR